MSTQKNKSRRFTPGTNEPPPNHGFFARFTKSSRHFSYRVGFKSFGKRLVATRNTHGTIVAMYLAIRSLLQSYGSQQGKTVDLLSPNKLHSIFQYRKACQQGESFLNNASTSSCPVIRVCGIVSNRVVTSYPQSSGFKYKYTALSHNGHNLLKGI